VFYGILNIKTGEVEYSNAGHNAPYLLHCDGKVEAVPLTGGIVLGAMEDIPYKSNTITLSPGDTLLLYTDGVTEAFSAEEELYSEERLEKLLESNYSKPIKEIVNSIVEDVKVYSTGVPQADDITLLSLKYFNNKL
jgi:sigma-B regulation protein RsbU (phosphoserine phosphatase)